MSLFGTSSDKSNCRHQCNPRRQNCPSMILASHSLCGHSFATCVASSESSSGRLCFISGNPGGRSLTRIVEEELIAVGIIDHQEPVTPRTILDQNAPGLEFAAQRVQRGDRGLV